MTTATPAVTPTATPAVTPAATSPHAGQGALARTDLTPIRTAIVVAMCIVLAVIATDVFDSWEWELLAAPLIAGAVAMAVARRPWRVRLAAATGAVVVATAVSVLLAGGDLGDVPGSVVDGPSRLLTTEWPSPADPRVTGAVALLLALTTAAAADLAGRRRWHLMPLAVVVTGLTAVMSLAAPQRPPALSMLLLAVLGLLAVLARPGEPAAVRSATLIGERALPVAIALIAIATVAAASAVAWADRADPRRTEAADTTSALVDPIEEVVALRAIDPPRDLFRVLDRSTLIGQALPARWRVAVIDGYDGVRWTPSVTLRPIGHRLGQPAPAAPDVVPPIRYSLQLLTDDTQLVPFPGRPLSIDLPVETDVDRTVVRLTERLAPGSTADVTSEVFPALRDSPATTLGSRQVDEIAATFTDLADSLAGDGTLLQRVRSIERTMRRDWHLDPGAPGGGLQQALIDRFARETRVGTAEQFVTAFVLLVRSLGIDARVATGFVVPPAALANPLVLSSAQAAAWPEVRVEGFGWMAFDPVPELTATGDAEPPPPPEAQSPAAAPPPVPPPSDEHTAEPEPVVDGDEAGGGWTSLEAWAVWTGVGAAAAVLPIAAAVGAILYVKARRRRRRLRAATPAARIRGAWANATDSLVDAGLAIAPSWTDATIAERAAAVAVAAPHEARRLASLSTAVTFGAATTTALATETVVADAIRSGGAVDEAIRSGRSRWQVLRWRLSLRSLRARTRSPVTA